MISLTSTIKAGKGRRVIVLYTKNVRNKTCVGRLRLENVCKRNGVARVHRQRRTECCGGEGRYLETLLAELGGCGK